MESCSEWGERFALYEKEGEAAPLARHVGGCAACLEHAAEEAPEIRLAELASRARLKGEYLDSLRMPWDLPRHTRRGIAPPRSAWLDGLRKAAAIALVVGAAWAGYRLYKSSWSYEPRLLSATQAREVSIEEIHSRYPLVRADATQTPYYMAVLPDGTRMVHFYVADF